MDVMNSKKYIKPVLEVTGNKLTIKIDYSENIKKYFLTDYAYVEYDQDMTNIGKSILYIPIVSNIITMAWAVGADIYVEELDKTFMGSLSKIKTVYEKWYPQFSFSTNLYVENVISNHFNGEGYGLLFSGGVDSLTSYIRHKNKNPDLFMTWDMAISEKDSKIFSKQQWKNVRLIKTNMNQVLNQKLLQIDYKVGQWFEHIDHALCLLGFCAPLTIKRIRTVFIASSHTEDYNVPWGSHPSIDNNIAWADVRIIHDGYELSRQDKIKYLAKYPEYLSNLMVCNFHKNYNCTLCEKCMRTITALILEGIDPGDCNFNLDNKKILLYIKDCWVKGRFEDEENSMFMWTDIQKHIPEQLNNDIYDSKEFFEWFREFDLSNYRKSKYQQFFWRYWKLFHLSPEDGMMKKIQRVPRFIARRLK